MLVLKLCVSTLFISDFCRFHLSVSFIPLASESLSKDFICTCSPTNLPFLPVFPFLPLRAHFLYGPQILWNDLFLLFLYILSPNSVCKISWSLIFYDIPSGYPLINDLTLSDFIFDFNDLKFSVLQLLPDQHSPKFINLLDWSCSGQAPFNTKLPYWDTQWLSKYPFYHLAFITGTLNPMSNFISPSSVSMKI